MFVGILCSLVTMAGTENPGNVGSSNTTVVGTSFSIDGSYVAGAGGVKIGNMASKGIKLRTNVGNALVISVNDGYEINNATLHFASNDNSKTVTISKVTVDGVDKSITGVIPNKSGTSSLDIALTGIDATDNITISFSTNAGTQIVGDFSFDYTQTEVITQEITSVAIAGANISEDQLATLKSNKTLEINASSYNGLPSVNPALNSGTTTVSCALNNNTATYSFKINSTDEYKVVLTNVGGTYTKQGNVVAFKEGETDAEGANTKTVTMNSISFAMVDESKTFQYGTGYVTLGSTKYTPLKLSTGSAVNVTFPEGKVATKVIVYGWSINNNGKLYCLQETDDASGKKVNVSSDVFYSGNNAYDIYPSVYEYTLDNWTSAYFSAGGSPSQPFVVMDFVLVDAGVAENVVTGENVADGYIKAGTSAIENSSNITTDGNYKANNGNPYIEVASGKKITINPTKDGIAKVVFADNAASYKINGGTTTNVPDTKVVILNVTKDEAMTIDKGSSTYVKSVELYYNQDIVVSPVGYTTCVAYNNLDFSESDAVAYVVSAVSESTLTITKVEKVAAGETIIVKAAEGTVSIPVELESVDPATNYLHSAKSAINYDEAASKFYYVLANGTNGIGFYQVGSGSIAANKGYVAVPKSAGAKPVIFIDDDATAADVVEAAQENVVSVKKFFKNGQLLIETTNGLVNAAGAQVK